MAIRLSKEAGQDMLITDGEIEIRGILDDIVILLRKGLGPDELSQNDIDTSRPLEEALRDKGVRSPANLYPQCGVSKGVAFISAGSHASRDDKTKIRQFVENYARQEGLPLDNLRGTLDVYVFGGDGFYVQNLPFNNGVTRVQYHIENGKLTKQMLVNELGLMIWPVNLTLANDIAEEIQAIYENTPDAKKTNPIKLYSNNPPGMKKDLFVKANGSYLYTVKKGPNQPDTSWDLSFDEYLDSLQQ